MKFAKSTWYWILGTISVLAIVGFFISTTLLEKITIKQETAQNIISSKLPMEMKKAGNPIFVVVQDCKIDFQNGQIEIMVNAGVRVLKKEINFIAYTQGDLRYQSGNFYFDSQKIKIDELTFVNIQVSDFHREALNEAIGMAVSHYLQNMPVYHLKNDFKGTVIRASLESVEVVDGAVFAHMSLWALTKTVVLSIVILAISIVMAIGIMLSPGGLGLVSIAALASSGD